MAAPSAARAAWGARARPCRAINLRLPFVIGYCITPSVIPAKAGIYYKVGSEIRAYYLERVSFKIPSTIFTAPLMTP